MKIYHGHASEADLERCRTAGPSLSHGVEWVNAPRMPIRDEPYILDNGAYAAAQKDEPWNKGEWYALLAKAHRQPREPDFVVLPDVYGDVERTHERHKRFVEVVRSHGYPYYAVAQPGLEPDAQVRFAEAIDADGVFMGGPQDWKECTADSFRRLTDRHGLQLHIGQPGDLRWAKDVGVDSVDTTSIVMHDAWHRLERLEGQQTLGGVEA